MFKIYNQIEKLVEFIQFSSITLNIFAVVQQIFCSNRSIAIWNVYIVKINFSLVIDS